jgi:hypothetical protein
MHRQHTEQYSTHLHTDSTQNSTAHICAQTVHRTVQHTFTHRQYTEQYSKHLHTDSTQNSTTHIYTQTAHRTVQYTFTHRQYTEQYSTHLHTDSTQLHTDSTQNNTVNLGRLRAESRFTSYALAFAYNWGKSKEKPLSQGSRKVPVGTMKIHKHTIRIHRRNNKNCINYSVKQ